jgi:hypothetical protein
METTYDFFANGMPDAPGLHRRGIWPDKKDYAANFGGGSF